MQLGQQTNKLGQPKAKDNIINNCIANTPHNYHIFSPEYNKFLEKVNQIDHNIYKKEIFYTLRRQYHI